MNALKHVLALRTRAEDAAADIEELISSAERAVNSVLSGEHAQRKSGGHEKFWQYREYMQGDRPQDIDWRQSAKTQRVYARQKEWQNTQDNILWCSVYDGMNFKSGNLPPKAEVAKTLTLALGLLFVRSGERAALLNHSNAGRSEKSLNAMAQELCLGAQKTSLPTTNKDISKNSSLVLIGDFLDDDQDLKRSFDGLSRGNKNGLVIQVLDPAELALPYDGRVVFEDMNGKVRENIQHVGSVRDAYQERIKSHISRVEGLCEEIGWHYVLHSTDHSISEALRTLWAEISQ